MHRYSCVTANADKTSLLAGIDWLLLTPQLVVVGAASCLPTAVAGLTQVAWVVVDTRAVLMTEHGLAA